MTSKPRRPLFIIGGVLAGLFLLVLACPLIFLGLRFSVVAWNIFYDSSYNVILAAPASAVPGRYELTESSRRDLTNGYHGKEVPPSSILLRTDGTVEATNVPDCVVSWASPAPGKYLSGTGSWKRAGVIAPSELKLTWKRGALAAPEQDAGLWNVYRTFGGGTILRASYGDPDGSEWIEWEKSPAVP